MKKTIYLSLLLMSILLFINTSLAQQQVLKDIDNNAYTTVQIGKQTWFKENLNVSRFRNGDSIPQMKTAEAWKKAGVDKKPAWCYLNFDPKNGKVFGKLYNCYAVADPRGLAPEKTHVPSEEEWNSLLNFIGGALSGGKLKESGITHWKEPNKGATNEIGFNALPAGTCRWDGLFYGESGSECCAFWSKTWLDLKSAYACDLSYHLNLYGYGYKSVENGFSVRCISDEKLGVENNINDTKINKEDPPKDIYEAIGYTEIGDTSICDIPVSFSDTQEDVHKKLGLPKVSDTTSDRYSTYGGFRITYKKGRVVCFWVTPFFGDCSKFDKSIYGIRLFCNLDEIVKIYGKPVKTQYPMYSWGTSTWIIHGYIIDVGFINDYDEWDVSHCNPKRHLEKHSIISISIKKE